VLQSYKGLTFGEKLLREKKLQLSQQVLASRVIGAYIRSHRKKKAGPTGEFAGADHRTHAVACNIARVIVVESMIRKYKVMRSNLLHAEFSP